MSSVHLTITRLVEIPHSVISTALGDYAKLNCVVLEYLKRICVNKHCKEVKHSIICDIVGLQELLLHKCEITDRALRIPVRYIVKLCVPTEEDSAVVQCLFESGIYASTCCKDVLIVSNNEYKKTDCCNRLYEKNQLVQFRPYHWKIGFRESDGVYIFMILASHVC
ncbi:hypothetical protein [Scale drop disease virus]|uniref:ORF_080R n=1 Tax=Scale drop disease virus TaxID=1697349 RepID=A0A0K1L780_9VIRU|nr:ORF_080R [Scale drop disease virus]AKU37495.1 ORF_080R [Scale drop disease virus]QLI60754.1 hypothetical protein [Scale drop disease virus]QXJ13672.1 ORF080R [Scale drop disease virus]UNH60701.1 hypothetical protein SDDV_ORF032 [Scale drop disease virus]